MDYFINIFGIIDTEGFVSYKDVELVLKPNRLELLYPNPISHETLNVQYKINKANSGYLMILSYYATTGIANNYIVDINSNEKNIE